ncbi:MAG: sulfotransferase [Phycisphaeraceae bacterium]|nr:sulfotransferase [Phycisphaeraceae bacterium]
MAERLPNFLFIGAAKCGSTWVYRALRAHPQVFVPPAKDVYYFDRYYHKGPHWYESFFRHVPPEALAVGELSHDYLFSPEAAQRIHHDLPGVKLLAMLRDPIERAWSAYLFQKRNGTAGRDFDQTLERSPNILQRGRYVEALEVYLNRFGSERLMVSLFDDLKADPVKLARDIYSYLGVDETFEFTAARERALGASAARIGLVGAAVKRMSWAARQMGMANLIGRVKDSAAVQRMLYRPLDARQREAEGRLTDSQKQRLCEYYQSDVDKLSRLLGRDLSHWLQ